MSDERSPWVGDLIHDKDADRRGIVTDVRGGSLWGLRPELGPGKPWTSDRPERLGLVTPREEMRDWL
ncbi:hypothetical protein [Streptomyces hirsutus]|uniref:hypothetical protein n=1 Tax=Streptomyces hirsutus TaxID=35620 RepID=UPI0006E30797|nr:hypothetical protein [Streptomyces hirsutus]